ncbi:MAG: PDZ domain-containing protein [Planctomycetota bacterium]|nr:MAG: PDZ domain-containing protein [Planctomycetota bacterium]
MRLRIFIWAVCTFIFLVTPPVLNGEEPAPAPDPEKQSRKTPVVKVVEKVNPSVVNISTEMIVRQRRRMSFDPFFDPFFDEFFGKYKTTSLGSGVIIDPEGYILTNAHVVLRATSITVKLSDKSEYNALLLATEPRNDLALIKIDPKPGAKLKAIEFGTSSDLMTGETAIALGNPLGLSNTVTVGVVSAVNRSVELNGRIIFKDFLQTDAAINPGNSGGPLANIKGKMIGLNTAIRIAAEGIGFAIPVDRVREELVDLVERAPLTTLYAGIRLRTEAGKFYIREVTEKSPADEAGVKADDLLVSVAGEKVVSAVSLAKEIARRKAGDKLEIEIKRGGKTKKLTLTLEKCPATKAEKLALKHLGLGVEKLTYSSARKANMKYLDAVVINEVVKDGPGDRIGFEKGDLLLEIAIIEQRGPYSVTTGSVKVTGLDELERFLSIDVSGRLVSVTIARDGERFKGKLLAR